MGKKQSDTRTIQSVERANRLLTCLAGNGAGLSLKELADKVNLAPQTVQSLLRTMQKLELVTQTRRGWPYMLGPAVPRLASQWVENRGLAASARSLVAELARETREYVLLAEMHGANLVPLIEERVERSLMLGRAIEFGPERLHCMATGQVLLAFLEPDLQKRLVASLPLPRHGPQSYTKPDILLGQLEKIRRQGFSVCRNQAADHIAALAVPVHDATGTVRASLGMSVPESRFNRQHQQWLLKKLQTCAAAIANQWGHRK